MHGVDGSLSWSVLPFSAHKMHVVDVAAEYSPIAQSSQGVVESSSRSACPAGQFMQSARFASNISNSPFGLPIQYCPGMHSTHGVVASPSWSEVPGEHTSHIVPPQLAYVPFAHTSHGVAASRSSSAVPGSHDTHATEPLFAYCPTWHASHASTPTFAYAGAYRPASHESHEPTRPTSELYWPRGHAVHGVVASASASARPATHGSHEVDLGGAYVPLAQVAHGVLGSRSRSPLPTMHSPHGASSPIVYVPWPHW
jgi:hypothetical protein